MKLIEEGWAIRIGNFRNSKPYFAVHPTAKGLLNRLIFDNKSQAIAYRKNEHIEEGTIVKVRIAEC